MIRSSMNSSPVSGVKMDAQNLLVHPFNETGKLVIFSEARDTTALPLAETECPAGFGPVLTVDSHNRKTVMPIVRANFDANVPHDAEHRCPRRLQNPHLHRSPRRGREPSPRARHRELRHAVELHSRLMQRIGRVNRIGSTAKFIHIFKFLTPPHRLIPTSTFSAKPS